MHVLFKRFILIFCLSSLGIFLVRYILLGQATYGDGRFYWAYLRSMVVRMDLDVAKELPHAWNHRSNNSEPPENESGAFSYPEQSMGYSVIVFPWIFGLHTLLLLLKEIGIPVVANGYSDVYQISTGILLIGCVSIAFFLYIGSWLHQWSQDLQCWLCSSFGSLRIFFSIPLWMY